MNDNGKGRIMTRGLIFSGWLAFVLKGGIVSKYYSSMLLHSIDYK
jgi:hypothetical protein